MVAFIVVLLIVGFIVGAIARLLMPGRDRLGILGTVVLGTAGSFVGGFLQNLIEYHSLSVHSFHPPFLYSLCVMILRMKSTLRAKLISAMSRYLLPPMSKTTNGAM